jgi:hypothetical protein
MRREIGGTPEDAPAEYAVRSPLSQARLLATAGVPLQIWWSRDDRIVFDQRHQSGALLDELRRLNPCAPVTAYVGTWEHSKEMRAGALLPIALAGFHLLSSRFRPLPSTVQRLTAAGCGSRFDDAR